MIITRLIVGPLETNCYILANEENDALIIDPGDDGEKIVSKLDKSRPSAILLTHGHYDHIGAVNFLADKLKIPIYAGQNEIEMLVDPDMNFSSMFAKPISVRAKPISQSILNKLGFHRLRIIELPGHTLGSIGVVGDDFIISGDTVFAGGGIGRTDLPHSDTRKLVESVNKILELPDDLILYPGHGGRSLLRREKFLWRQTIKLLDEGLLE